MGPALSDRDPTTLKVRVATGADEAATVALWRKCGLIVKHNDPDDDFRFALAGATSDVLLAEMDGRVAGSIMVGHDGHRGWVYYLASDPDCRLEGVGRTLVETASAWLSRLGVRKVQLLVRQTNVDVIKFYERVGFEKSDVILMQRWLADR